MPIPNYSFGQNPATQPHYFNLRIDNSDTKTDDQGTSIEGGQTELPLLRTESVSDYFNPKGTTSSEVENPILLAIEEAAAEEDRETFALLAKQVKWQEYQPYELTRTIDLCLSLDLLPLATELISLGRKIFPFDKKIETMKRILSPPRIVGSRPSGRADVEKSKLWFKNNSSKYKGKWIAVHKGELLAEASTAKELYGKIGKRKKNPNTIIVKVLP